MRRERERERKKERERERENLDVAVHDVEGMEVLEAEEGVEHVVGKQRLREGAVSRLEEVEASPLDVLQDEVHVLLRLFKVFQPHDVRV